MRYSMTQQMLIVLISLPVILALRPMSMPMLMIWISLLNVMTWGVLTLILLREREGESDKEGNRTLFERKKKTMKHLVNSKP